MHDSPAAGATTPPSIVSVESFFRTILRQDLTSVYTGLTAGIDANAVDQYGNTALHWASILDNPHLVKLLLRCGADPNARAALTGATPLLIAIDHEATEVLASLLAAGAELSLSVSSIEGVGQRARTLNLTAVDLAARRNRPDIVRLLVENGAPVATRQSQALAFAFRSKNVELFRFLLSKGAWHPDMEETSVFSFIEQAIHHRHGALLDALLQHGARTKDPTYALSRAVRTGDMSMFKAVLTLEPALDGYGDGDSESPLIAAASEGTLLMVDELLARNANPLLLVRADKAFEHHPPPRGIDSARTALSEAARVGSYEVFLRLLQMKGYSCDMFGAALLAAAARPDERAHAIVDALIERTTCFSRGENEVLSAALLRAVEAGSGEIAELLLSAGASTQPIVDIRYSRPIVEPIEPQPGRASTGWRGFGPTKTVGYFAVSPLEIAVGRRNFPIVQLLVKAGASVMRDFPLTSSLSELVHPRARGLGTQNPSGDVHSIVRFLLAHGASMDRRDPYGMTALMRAAEDGDVVMLDALMKAGADLTMKNGDGLDAASIAKRANRPDAVRLLQRQAELDEVLVDTLRRHPWNSLPADPVTDAVCIKNPKGDESFTVGRSGVTAVEQKLPMTPFAGYLAVDVTIEAEKGMLPKATRTAVASETLNALAIWRMVCPNCAPWNLAIAHVDGTTYMIESCYREIRDIPQRKFRRPGIPQYGDPSGSWQDAFEYCARRYGMGRGLENATWRYVPVPAGDPVRKIACETPDLNDVAVALRCPGKSATAAGSRMASVTLGFTLKNTLCPEPASELIACASFHQRVDINTSDFQFLLSGDEQLRFGRGKIPLKFSRVMLHEVGHWLGLDHQEGANNIMSHRFVDAQCISNDNVDELADPIVQSLSLHSGVVEALVY